jgi:hypothetical protein
LVFQLGDAMFVELPRVRLDGGARAFRQYWGYESARQLAPPPPLIEEDEACIEPETVSLREANTASPIGEYLWVNTDHLAHPTHPTHLTPVLGRSYAHPWPPRPTAARRPGEREGHSAS